MGLEHPERFPGISAYIASKYSIPNKDKKLNILKILDSKDKDKYLKFAEDKANFAATKAGYDEYQKTEPYGGGFSQNPYNKGNAETKMNNSEKEFIKWQIIYDYALESLLE